MLTLSTCDADDGACGESDDPVSLMVENRTGDDIMSITATPCDGGDEQELSLPSEGIPFTEQSTVGLPGPGCWLLHWDGGGCSNDPPHRTSTNVCGGETYAWTADTQGRICEGGW